jgi:hypothetical protein
MTPERVSAPSLIPLDQPLSRLGKALIAGRDRAQEHEPQGRREKTRKMTTGKFNCVRCLESRMSLRNTTVEQFENLLQLWTHYEKAH